MGNAALGLGMKQQVRALRSARLAMDMRLEAGPAHFWEVAMVRAGTEKCRRIHVWVLGKGGMGKRAKGRNLLGILSRCGFDLFARQFGGKRYLIWVYDGAGSERGNLFILLTGILEIDYASTLGSFFVNGGLDLGGVVKA